MGFPPETFEPWSAEEHARFRAAYQQTRDVRLVADAVQSRTVAQVQTHAELFAQYCERAKLLAAVEELPVGQVDRVVVPVKEWTLEEQQILEDTLKQFPRSTHTHMDRMLIISSQLTDKLAKDVAVRHRWMLDNCDAPAGEAPPRGAKGRARKAQTTQPPAPPKRAKTARTKSNSAPASATIKEEQAPAAVAFNVPMITLNTGLPSPNSDARSSRASAPRVSPRHDVTDGLTIDEVEGMVAANETSLATIRQNLLSNNLQQNWAPMRKFHENVTILQARLPSMTGLERRMPPLTVHVETAYLMHEKQQD